MKVVYPGSFDPITLGHLEMIERASRLFDSVTVAVLKNPAKKGFLPLERRLELIRESTAHLSNVRVDCFDGLLADYVRKTGAGAILRGIRSEADCASELPAAQCNRVLNAAAETLFMCASPSLSHVSSSAVREIYAFGGDYSQFVPACVLNELNRMKSEG